MYRHMRRHRPPQDPKLRRQWAADRLQEDSNRLLDDLEEQRGDLDELFAELDASLAYSRQVCDALAVPFAQRWQEQLHNQELQPSTSSGVAQVPPISIFPYPTPSSSTPTLLLEEPVHVPRAGRRASRMSQSNAHEGDQVGGRGCSSIQPPVDWQGVVARARARHEVDCPICLGALKRRGEASVAWLSCSHTFHLDCIVAFEAFELTRGGEPRCPVCRCEYQRKTFA